MVDYDELLQKINELEAEIRELRETIERQQFYPFLVRYPPLYPPPPWIPYDQTRAFPGYKITTTDKTVC